VSAGYHVMATLAVRAPRYPLSFRAEGLFHELDYNAEVGPSGGAPYRAVERSARVWGATANGILKSSGLLGTYLIAGVGGYRVTEAVPLLGGTRTDGRFGVNAGGGFLFELTGFSTYVEARYHWVGDSDVRLVPITFGVSF
jgi:hypothetical protein